MPLLPGEFRLESRDAFHDPKKEDDAALDPRSALVIAPWLRHVGGHGQASPSPQTATLPKSGKGIERRVIATFPGRREAVGFKREFRQREHLLALPLRA